MTQQQKAVWLASYPRSGSTFLRTVLYHCFGFRSGSVYPADLGGNRELEAYVGHIEQDANGRMPFPSGCHLRLIKTHELPPDANPAIYMVRNGKRATLSLYDYYRKEMPLRAIIAGQNRFGTWANHVATWRPWDRPHTLLLRYEEVVSDLFGLLAELSRFLDLPILAGQIPDRDAIASVDDRWVREEGAGTRVFPDELLALFDETNGEMMQKMGYPV